MKTVKCYFNKFAFILLSMSCSAYAQGVTYSSDSKKTKEEMKAKEDVCEKIKLFWHVTEDDHFQEKWTDLYIKSIESVEASENNPESKKAKDDANKSVFELCKASKSYFPFSFIIGEEKRQLKLCFNSKKRDGSINSDLVFYLNRGHGGSFQLTAKNRQSLYRKIQEMFDLSVLRNDMAGATALCRLGIMFDSVGHYDGANFLSFYARSEGMINAMRRRGVPVSDFLKKKTNIVANFILKNKKIVEDISSSVPKNWGECAYVVPPILSAAKNQNRITTDDELKTIIASVRKTVDCIQTRTGADSLISKSTFSYWICQWRTIAVNAGDEKLVEGLDEIVEEWKKNEADIDVRTWINDIKRANIQ